MVRTQSKAATARKVLPESSDSEESESQPETSRASRKTARQQPQKQQNQSTRSRKQNQPQKQQQSKSRVEQDVQPPRRPGTSSAPRETPLLRDIRILQQRPENNIIPRAPFGRLLKEILQSHGEFRISKDAFDCLKEALEAYLVELFEDSYRLALHRKRVTLIPADLSLVLYLRGNKDPGYSNRR